MSRIIETIKDLSLLAYLVLFQWDITPTARRIFGPPLRWLASWRYDALQLGVLLATAAVFIASPAVLTYFDPTAGVFDLGYLQRPLVAAAYFFFATFATWLALRFSFPDANAWVDKAEGWREAWDDLSPAVKLGVSLGLFFGLLVIFITCLALVPV